MRKTHKTELLDLSHKFIERKKNYFFFQNIINDKRTKLTCLLFKVIDYLTLCLIEGWFSGRSVTKIIQRMNQTIVIPPVT